MISLAPYRTGNGPTSKVDNTPECRKSYFLCIFDALLTCFGAAVCFKEISCRGPSVSQPKPMSLTFPGKKTVLSGARKMEFREWRFRFSEYVPSWLRNRQGTALQIRSVTKGACKGAQGGRLIFIHLQRWQGAALFDNRSCAMTTKFLHIGSSQTWLF